MLQDVESVKLRDLPGRCIRHDVLGQVMRLSAQGFDAWLEFLWGGKDS